MHLLVNGASLSIAEMGPSFLRLRAAGPCDPCLATVVFRVNASESRWAVYLPQGIKGTEEERVLTTLPPGQSRRQETTSEEHAES